MHFRLILEKCIVILGTIIVPLNLSIRLSIKDMRICSLNHFFKTFIGYLMATIIAEFLARIVLSKFVSLNQSQ